MRRGYSVPPGFVITTHAFRPILDECRQSIRESKSKSFRQNLQQARDTILQWQIPERLRHAVHRGLSKLDERLAVRSSLIGEDTFTSSFAGQLDSVLNIRTEDQVLDAVKQCLASAFNWGLIRYIQEHTPGDAENYIQNLSMAVIVQEMVSARASGVVFTADPVSGRPWTIIEASPGLGEDMTKGVVDPDRYVRDETNALTKHKPDSRDDYVLSENQIHQLEQISRQVAGHSDTPRDIEWAWDGTMVYLLQDRPITTLQNKKIYSNRMVSDMLPGLIKPLVWTINAEGKLKNTLGRVFTEIIGPNDYDFTKLAEQIHSRLYANNSMLGLLFTRMGLPPNFFEMMSREEKSAGKKRFHVNARSLLTLLRLFRFAWKNMRTTHHLKSAIHRHNEQLDRFRKHDWETENERAVLDRIEELIDLYSDSMWINFIGPINMMIRQKILARFSHKHAPDVEPTDLLRGLMGLKSLESNREIQGLASLAKNLDREMLQHLKTRSDDRIRQELGKTQAGRDLCQAMDSFLDKYGFLSALGTDISRPAWIENPAVIWHAVAQRVEHPPARSSPHFDAIRARARQEVCNRLKAGQRLLFGGLFRSTVKFVQLREQSSFLVSEDSFHLRQAFLALARMLKNKGLLDDTDDLFYLYLDEIHELVARGESSKMRRCIAERRTKMEEDSALDLPDVIYGDVRASFAPREEPERSFLTGIVGCSGHVQGRARIIFDPAEAPTDLTQEDILVVPFSDTSWTPLFSGIGGLIAETGGLLSHTAIIAREYGLPAMVSVKRVTRLIREGQSITLDANQGRVYLTPQKGD